MKKNILTLAVGAALVAGTTGASSLPELKAPQPHAKQRVAVEATFEKDAFAHAARVGEDKISVIIQLEDAPLAMFEPVNPAMNAKSGEKAKLADNLESKTAKDYKNFLRQKQNEFVSQAKQLDEKFKSNIRYDSLLNGIAATVDKNKVHLLAKLPGVKSVSPDTLFHAQMDRSLDIIRAKEVWESLGGSTEAGKGVKVAVVDSGIRPENPLFSGEGFTAPEGLPTDDYCSLVDEDFCNGKLIVARSATLTEEQVAEIYQDEYPNNPLAFNGHGTHVAGTAVGNWGVTATLADGTTETIGGVAPGAYLMVYKGLYAFPSNPSSSSGYGSWLIEMMEAAVEDGADIINNSWGSGPGIANPAYEEVFMAAKAAGATMVFAAGNDGPGDGTVGAPSTSKYVLTVGGTTTSRYQVNQLNVADAGVDGAFAIVSGPIEVDADFTAPMIYAGSVAADNFQGCNAFEDPEAFTGHMALISRGSCAFVTKIANAQAAGATGVIIFNNNPGESPFGMGGLDFENQTIPSAMVAYEAGAAIAEYLGTAETETSATLTASQSVENAMYQFSGRGPNADTSILKPNVLAPGQQILSAESPVVFGNDSGQEFSIKSGTSMASPHVAGAAALVKQAHPDWTPDQIMSAVTHTAVLDGLVEFDLTEELTPFDTGAGRIDVVRATQAELTFSELGLAEPNCYLECSWTVTVTNATDSDISVNAETMIDGAGYELSVSPASATLAAGSETELTITVNATAAQTLDTWVFGGVTWDDGNSATPEYYIPLAVNAIDSDTPSLLTSSTSGNTAAAGDSVTMSASITNTSLTDTIEFKADFDDRLVVDTASAATTVDGEAQTTTYDAADNSVSWSGVLDPASFTIEADTQPADELALFGIGSYFSMASFGAAPLTCSASCDDSFVTVDLASPITYLGDSYSTMHVSSNGFVVLGDDSTGANYSLTQELPSSDVPNNVVAPLWMDLDLAGGDGAGEMYAVDLDLRSTFGCGICSDYYVVEWRGAEIYQVPGEAYTFQIWFEKGTNNAFFYYGEVGSFPATLNQFGLGLTVGAENSNGGVGITSTRIAADGTLTGTLPAAGDIVKLSAGSGGSLDFTATAALPARGALVADSIEIDEDNSGSNAVLENDLDRTFVTEFSLASGAISAKTFKAVSYDFASLDTTSLAVTDGPANGSATVNTDGSITYSPAANYNGTDSFTYSVTDAEGVVNTAEVNVTINPVDDAPTMTVSAPDSTVEGHYFDIVVAANDVDGDPLTVTINGAQATSVRVLAPEVDKEGTTLSYNVVVSDGTTTLTDTVTVRVDNAPSSGGSMAWYSLLLLPLTWLRRRKMR